MGIVQLGVVDPEPFGFLLGGVYAEGAKCSELAQVNSVEGPLPAAEGRAEGEDHQRHQVPCSGCRSSPGRWRYL